MTQKLPLFVALLLTGISGIMPLASAAAAEETQAPAGSVAFEAVPAAPAEQTSPASLCLGTAETTAVVEAAPDWLAASSCCRPQCTVDRDCDRICGTGLGVCRMVNSCCKACLCSAL